MKKLILSVFMFALIAGASVNSTANATLGATPGVVATPNLIYCITGHDIINTSAGALGSHSRWVGFKGRSRPCRMHRTRRWWSSCWLCTRCIRVLR